MTNPSNSLYSGGDIGVGNSRVVTTKRRKTLPEPTYPSVEELSRSDVLPCTPGKKGGEFELLGTIIVVPPSVFGKRDQLTVTRVAPSERHLYFPDVAKGESLSGHIYEISASVPLSRGVAIRLPYCHEERRNYGIKLKWKPHASDDNPNPTWDYFSTFHMVKTSRGDLLELMTEQLGTFAVVSALLTETFQISPQGCLYNSHTNRHINIRFPKKYLDKAIEWELLIWPMRMDRAEHTKSVMYISDCSEFIACSDFFELRSPEYKGEQFRRPVTIRVPLPSHLETDAENNVDRPDLSVLCKTEKDGDDWELIEGNVKFTKDSASFDVSRFSVFAIVQSKPGRGKRLQPAIPKIYQQNFKIQGDIVTFLSLEKKRWFLWIEAVKGQGCTETAASSRTAQKGVDLKYYEYSDQPVEEKKVTFSGRRSYNRIRRSAPETPEAVTDNIEFSEGSSLLIDITGDVETVDGDNNSQNLPFYYSEKSRDNYRIFEIRPTTLEERQLTFVVEISKMNPAENKYKRVRHQSFTIDQTTVKNYFFVEPEPEPEPMEIEVSISSPEKDESEMSSPSPQKKPSNETLQPVLSNAFLRLTTLTKPRVTLCKEPKVLSGKSLQTLSKQIPEGLTLAVYLNVPDSTITGIGFDALSNGHSLNMVTYKILLAWKRKAKPRDKLVEMLVDALKDMGRYDITDVLLTKHKENVELSPQDFM